MTVTEISRMAGSRPAANATAAEEADWYRYKAASWRADAETAPTPTEREHELAWANAADAHMNRLVTDGFAA